MPGGQPHCYTCHKPIMFDDDRVGKNGKKIPLDPDTNEPHQCEAGAAASASKTDFEIQKILERVKGMEERLHKLEVLTGESTPMSRLTTLERKIAEMDLIR